MCLPVSAASDPEQVWTEDGYTTPYHVYNATYLVDSDAQITLPNTDQATMGNNSHPENNEENGLENHVYIF